MMKDYVEKIKGMWTEFKANEEKRKQKAISDLEYKIKLTKLKGDLATIEHDIRAKTNDKEKTEVFKW